MIYAVRWGRFVKIGMTIRLADRIKQLRLAIQLPGVPDAPIELLGTMDVGGRQEDLSYERFLHWHLREHQEVREWFRGGPAVDEVVESIRDGRLLETYKGAR